MKSRTSFFNAGVLKKDITRFAPLWGLYTVFLLLYLFLMLATPHEVAYFVMDVPDFLQSMGVLNLLYAGLCAVLLYGDLFQSKLMGALHAMPLRREGWFFTHLTAGMLFCLVPNGLAALIAGVHLGQYAYLAGLWLAVTFLQFLFFFGLGTFSVQCAGNALGAFAVYGIVNFLAVLVTFLAITFYEPALFGIRLDGDALCRFSPVVAFSESEYVSIGRAGIYPGQTAVFKGFLTADWVYLFVAAGVGLAFLICALLLYRRRQLERAGDFMAVKPAAPVFLLLYTLCVGAVFYVIADAIAQELGYVFLVIGLAVGFFTGLMLLEKKVNVFRWKRFFGFGLLVAMFFLSLLVTWLDPIGITRRIPDTEQVKFVKISPYATTYYRDDCSRILTEPEDIDVIRRLHEELVRAKNAGARGGNLTVTYQLKNGISLTRQYPIETDSAIGKTLRQYYSHMDAIFGTEDVHGLLLDAEFVEFNSHYPEELLSITISDDSKHLGNTEWEEKYGDGSHLSIYQEGALADAPVITSLLEAIRKDCEAGNMAQVWDYHPGADALGYLAICVEQGGYTSTVVDLCIYSDCENTVAYLRDLVEDTLQLDDALIVEKP